MATSDAEKRLLTSKLQSRNATTTHANKESTKGLTLLPQTPYDIAALTTCLGKLDSYLTRISAMNDQIHALLDGQSLAADIEKSEQLNESLLDVIAQIKTAISIGDASNTSRHADFDAYRSGVSGLKTVRLPKLEMQKFDGDPKKWEEFWDTFLNTVHENDSLPTIDKFKYLKGFLEGKALVLAEGYRLTAVNYETVIAALKERFGNPELAVYSHFDSMLALPSAACMVSELQQTFDECEKHVRSLVALGLNEAEFGRVFTPIIMSKLPAELRIELHRRNGSALWTLSNLRLYFREELQARDMSSWSFGARDTAKSGGVSHKSEGKRVTTWHEKQGTASALVASDQSKGNRSSQSYKPGPRCRFCEGRHFSDQCLQYPDLNSRRKKIKGNCFSCLGKGHTCKECKFVRKCVYCGAEGHHRSLCRERFGSDAKDDTADSSKDSKRVSGNMLSQGSRGVLQTALASVRGQQSARQARLLFDNGADNAFITNGLARQLGAKCLGSESISLAGFQDTRRSRTTRKMFQFQVILKNGEPFTIKAYGTDQITCPVDKYAFDIAANPFLSQVELAEPLSPMNTHVPIDILLGSDYYYKLLNIDSKPIALNNGLVLLDSKLGYIIGGSIESDSIARTSLLLTRTSTLDTSTLDEVENIWKLDAIGIREPKERDEDQEALKYFDETIKFDEAEQRYLVKWPWNSKQTELQTNYQLAFGRLKSLMRQLKQDSSLRDKYAANISDQLNQGIIEEVPDSANGTVVHYLPHHFVVTPQKTTTKLRIVYDGSSKVKGELLSLNACMHRGPIILENLCALLIRFRLPRIGIVSDLEKAFLQVGLQLDDRDAVRFLWLKDCSQPVSDSNLLHLRFRRVCFGVISSPFLLAGTLCHHLDRVSSSLSAEIKRSLYVDNVIAGKDDLQEAKEYYQGAKSVFQSASMNLREWYSNDVNLIRQLPLVDQGKSDTTNVLGLQWDLKTDVLNCQGSLAVSGVPNTKRSILQAVAKIFDPCGYWSPVIAPGKWLIQELWQKEYQWDSPLTDEMLAKWAPLFDQLQSLHECPVPRHYGFTKDQQSLGVELHCFCDASAKAYCAAVYMRLPGHNAVLVFAKCRVSPLKTQTIPRLELLAVTIGVRLLQFVSNELDLPISSKYIWSDPQCVLHWILGRCPTAVFVKNRVNEIAKSNDIQLRYVSTSDNPADLPTRGLSVQSLKVSSLWWNGPAWLADASKWPDFPLSNIQGASDDPENCESAVAAVETQSNDDYIIDVPRFSSLTKLLRVTVFVIRFVNKLKRRPVRNGQLDATEMQLALAHWERMVQNEHFKTSTYGDNRIPEQLKKLSPIFQDSNGILRRKGRLEYADVAYDAQHPKIIPKRDPFVRLLIQDFHERLNHAGVSHVLASIRSKYWIIQARSQIKTVIARCLKCRRQKGGPFQIPEPPDLPDFRVSAMRPFSTIGLDYFGPLFVQSPDGSPSKVWVALFTCASTRAVHLEVVNRMDTEQFLLAFRRFISLCGTPNLVVSDNAKHFHSSKKLFDKLWYDIRSSNEVAVFSSKRKIEWKFIPESAPWMGGFYERLVGVVKMSLKSALQNMRMDITELQTCVYETATIVNSRPLVYVEDDMGQLILTPAHFLLRDQSIFPSPIRARTQLQDRSAQDQLLERWTIMQRRLHQVWKAWRKCYLSSLHSQWRSQEQRHVIKFVPQIDEVVLVHESFLPRSKWKIARIESLVESNDGKIRAAKLRLPDQKQIQRPIKLLYPLETRETTFPTRATEIPKAISDDNGDCSQVETQKSTEVVDLESSSNDNSRHGPQMEEPIASRLSHDLADRHPTLSRSTVPRPRRVAAEKAVAKIDRMASGKQI